LLGDSEESFLGEVSQQHNSLADCFEKAAAAKQECLLEFAITFAAATVTAI